MRYGKAFLICLLGLLLISCGDSLTGNKQNRVEIVRDNYGVPHIYAESNFGLFYGYGYAVAQDRLFQMAMTRRSVLGTVAEVMGADYLDLDKQVRQGFNPDSIKKQIDQLTPEQKDVFEGYAAGFNRWIDEIKDDPENLLPYEFIHHGFEPQHWEAYDVVMLFAGTMAYRYADFNEEISNLAFYQDLVKQHGNEKGWAIFDATLPPLDGQSPTTVPELTTTGAQIAEMSPPGYLAGLNPKAKTPAREAFHLSGKFNALSPEKRRIYNREHLSQSGISGRSGFSTTSNVWLVNKKKVRGAKAVLVNGPQFGWANPSYVYGVGLHGAGFDVVGNTMLAYPLMLFAHNGNVGWGSTAGFGDQVDIFELKLNPENQTQYLHNGVYRDFEVRQELIAVKGADPVEFTVFRSVYGPVIQMDQKNGIAYSQKRTWEGSEVETGIAWVELAKAKTIEELRGQIKKMATNINFYYLDKSGNIGYTLSGKYPIRQEQQDTRLPVPGDGSMDWQGILPFEENPTALNPEQGYIVNWNNRPERGWNSSDLWWRNWSKADRANVLIDELDAQERLNPDQMWAINARSSFADLNVAYLLPALNAAFEGKDSTGLQQKALQSLQGWDKYWWDKNNDGYFDSAGPAIMDVWLKALLEYVFKDDVGDAFFYRFASPGYPIESIKGAVAVSPGIKLLVRNLDGQSRYDFLNGESSNAVLLKTFEQAVKQLETRFGTDLKEWKMEPHPLQFRPYNFRGAPQALSDNQPQLPVIMNRGSENNRFVAKDKKITGVDVFAPGQSGFIAPDGTPAKHYKDQMELYQNFGYKSLPFERYQVEQMAELKTRILY